MKLCYNKRSHFKQYNQEKMEHPMWKGWKQVEKDLQVALRGKTL
jgi:hypothetical protein